MKKNIIIAAIAAASALLLSVSCQKENQPEIQNGINGGAKTFTATIEQGLTKTTITSEHKVNWTATDKISINGKVYTAAPKGDATKADFTAEDGEASAVSGKYNAIYPSTLYVTDHFALPATQTYTAGEFNAPMYAESETTTLSFKNICAVLAIKVTSDDIDALKFIKVKADKKLHGIFTVNSTTDGGYKAVIGTDGTNEVVLSMGETAIDLTTDGITFYIAIPAQEYSYLNIYLSEDGTLYKRAMITKKAAGLGTIACNTIYNITYETNAVQMYTDGPYWSTMNLGATAVTGANSYGTYFAWGETTEHALTADAKSQIANPSFVAGTAINNAFESAHDFSWNNCPWTNDTYSSSNKNVFTKYIPSSKTEYWNGTDSPDNKITLDLADDAAAVNWGGTWRMPIGYDATGAGEFKALKDATYWAWDVTDCGYYVFAPDGSHTAGTRVSSIPTGLDKGSALLFFPAAGCGGGTSLYDAGSGGDYWSSSLSTGSPNDAYSLRFDSGDVSPQDLLNRYIGFSVRPVSD